MLRLITVLALALAMVVVTPEATADDWAVERVVVLMRHGVRPPLKEPPLPATVAPEQWPKWEVPLGHLTAHGAAAIRLLAASDARRFVAEGILPSAGCPPADATVLMSDSMQRTVATGDNYLAALAPNCAVPNSHARQGEPDPLFGSYRDVGISAAAAQQAIDSALGPEGTGGVDKSARSGLEVVNRILCNVPAEGCGVIATPTGIDIDPSGRKRPKMTGAVGYGATAAQIFLLEYAEGKPMSEVGWGRATHDDLRTAGMLHAEMFATVARPRPLAFANAGRVVKRIVDSIVGGPRLTIVVGHDTDIANVGGLLDVHWSIPGFADDDPAPGGAMIFEVLRNHAGAEAVRGFYRSQTLDGIRALDAADPTWVALPPPGCGGQVVCPLHTFTALLSP